MTDMITHPGYYKYSHTLRVDARGNGDFTSVSAACVYAATLPRGTLTGFVLIEINASAPLWIEATPFTIPTYCILQGVAWNDTLPGTYITRGLGAAIPASDTQWITIAAGGSVVLNDLVLIDGTLPANFNAEYGTIRGTTTGLTLSRCAVQAQGNNYAGANAYAAILAGSAGIRAHNCYIFASGTGATAVKSSGPCGIYGCWLDGNPANGLNLTHVNPASKTTVSFSRFGTEPGVSEPTVYIRGANANTAVRLFDTRVPLDRVTTATVNQYHTTPQQLQIALRAVTRTETANYAVNAYNDGTVIMNSATDKTVTLPDTNTCIDGQSFAVKTIQGTVEILTFGGLSPIEGGIRVWLVQAQESVILQWNNQSSEWRIIADNRPEITLPLFSAVSDVAPASSFNSVYKLIVADSSLGVVTINLPLSSTRFDGRRFEVKRRGANTVTISGNGSLIDNALASMDITTDGDSLGFVWDDVFGIWWSV